ncbi:MAG TPA: hypothetical protein PKZ97_16570 [Azospirillaceae bacterium]|nr:hypothetical protein [Azospirillaceae bacterium]
MSIAELKELLAIGVPLATIVLVPAVSWWLTQRFVTRAEFVGVKERLDLHEARLDDGERRFAAVEAAIREVTHAADDARRAAETATKAADKIHAAEVRLAELGGKIDTVSELLRRVADHTDVLMRGHLDVKGDV